MLLNIISLVIGGLGIGSLITFFVQRHDARKGLESRLYKVEKDAVRTQILLMMYNYDPSDEHELLTCAEYYFKKRSDGGLEGDWWLTSKFKRFIKQNGIENPTWFKGEE